VATLEFEAFVASQRAVLDALRVRDVEAPRLADLWQRCEAACVQLERALANGTVDAALGAELAKSRALAALTAHAVGERLDEVQRDLGRVRAAKKRLVESDRRTRGSGSSCDISG
jgi:hypothetical protein